ncbi:hypothetical protein FSP39_003665 [Pinctada imbricata]|uniref:Uncharacterized protein n=1 Tax=Pinctada imbricata TaxID=66713 RepID=A0AA88XYP3_PINIB|nr:hypothetical protein FSP39_003665 [Pinctada imbricata]
METASSTHSAENSISTSQITNMTTITTTGMINGTGGGHILTPSNNKALELALVSVLTVIVVTSFVVFVFYKKCGIPAKLRKLVNLRKQSMMTGNHQRLRNADSDSIDLPPPRTERELFSIGDTDDLDMRTGAGPDDGYFYDEIYERSAFVDELTNTSLKELKTSNFKGKPPDSADLNYKVTDR